MNNFNASQVSSDTSDPSTAHMRVFVGNLNTVSISKPTLQNIFGKYGDIIAISIHRGFAFIQYSNQYAARSAVQGEHGSVIAGQTIDINISSEPKPNQKPASQQTGATHAFIENMNSPSTAFNPGQPTKRGRGGRGGARGALASRGTRGRGGTLGRGAAPNKVQSGRVEKSFQIKKKPMLPPLASRVVNVESPVIGPIKSPIKGVISAVTAPDGTQTVDLTEFRKELTEVRNKINSLLECFPASILLRNKDEVVINNGGDSPMEEVKNET